MTTEEPPKFINESGVRKMNPAWKAWKNGASAAPTAAAGNHNQDAHDVPLLAVSPSPAPVVSIAPAMRNEATSLPVVSNMQQFSQLGSDAVATNGYQQAAEHYQSAAVAQKVGLSEDQMLEQLSRVFAKYEIPMGLLQKLFVLESFDVMEAIVDDSGSMSCSTDSKHPDGRQMTRWEEALRTITQMVELLAYIPFPPFHLRFLNHPDHLILEKNQGEAPEAFIKRCNGILTAMWAKGTPGCTPALERIRESLNRHSDKAVVRYFLGDGTPDGGVRDQNEITRLLVTRSHPEKNPFTFFSCTDDDSATQWMKDAEEAATFCSEFDDFMDESEEILGDQGKAMPYSYGMHLVGSLVGALFEDLDGMDEASPFTKTQMSELTGYHLTDPEYDFYFQEFLAAQGRKSVSSAEDRIKSDYCKKWPAIKEEFRTAERAGDILLVKEYRQKMKDHQASAPPPASPEPYQYRAQISSRKDDDCCCVIA